MNLRQAYQVRHPPVISAVGPLFRVLSSDVTLNHSVMLQFLILVCSDVFIHVKKLFGTAYLSSFSYQVDESSFTALADNFQVLPQGNRTESLG